MAPDTAPLIEPSSPPKDGDHIPVLDVGPYFAGKPGAQKRLAEELRHSLENIGFYYLIGHDIALTLIEETFDASKRFHAQILDFKISFRAN